MHRIKYENTQQSSEFFICFHVNYLLTEEQFPLLENIPMKTYQLILNSVCKQFLSEKMAINHPYPSCFKSIHTIIQNTVEAKPQFILLVLAYIPSSTDNVHSCLQVLSPTPLSGTKC